MAQLTTGEDGLTLHKINCSQEEMSYITRMRNAIQFQILSSEDCEFLKNTFQHSILCTLRTKFMLETCLRHTLSKIVRSHVIVHECAPFQQWKRLNIDSDGFPVEHISEPREDTIQKFDENGQTERYLVAIFQNSKRFCFDIGWRAWSLLQKTLFKNTRLEKVQINNVDYFNFMHASIWKRVYGNNYIQFSHSDASISSYVKEQTQRVRPIRVFNEIIKRERGEFFNLYGVLQTLASPYYYVLPYHKVGRNVKCHHVKEILMILRVRNNYFQWDDLLYFESKLSIARKNMAHL